MKEINYPADKKCFCEPELEIFILKVASHSGVNQSKYQMVKVLI